MLLLVLHVIVLVVLIVVNMLACVPTTLQSLMSTKLVEFRYKSEIWAPFSGYVMVKWGDWGHRPNPYSSHINVIYIKGVWQPLYAVDVHMDVSPPPYGHSCQPSLWNFATNLGKSQLICDGEMRWVRLLTQPIFISHQCYIYIRCLTTFICCGCAYGCVPTKLRPLMPTKLVEFCYKSGQVPADVMVKWGELGCRPNPYSSYIYFIYI